MARVFRAALSAAVISCMALSAAGKKPSFAPIPPPSGRLRTVPVGDDFAPGAYTGYSTAKEMPLKEAEYDIPKLDMPKDEEGFVQSFDLDETDDWLMFFDTYGIVVVRNILSDEDCDKTVAEMWQALEGIGITQDDPRTWARMPWGAHMGFLGNNAFFGPAACNNRQNTRLYTFFKRLYGAEELVVSIDRLGYMRPTEGLSVDGYDVPVDVPQWKSMNNWVHWDMNPFSGSTSTYAYQGNYPNNPHNVGFTRLKTQGIVALADASEAEGGFHAIPGFHRHMQAWGRKNWASRLKHTWPAVEDDTTMQVPYEDPIRAHVQTMPIRKGSLLVWNSAIPHGTYPNHSNRPRIVQYLKMAPVRDPAIVPAAKNSTSLHNTVRNFSPAYLPTQDFKLTALGRKLYGFEDWDTTSSADVDAGGDIQ